MRRGALAVAIAVAALLAQALPAAAALPPIKHVFIVVLENEDAGTTFGKTSKAPYLAHALRARGAFVPGYYGIGHESLDNYIAMVSGQGPNPYTQADAPAYVDFVPAIPGPDGQYLGSGSVYPAQVKTVVDQIDAKPPLAWRGYMEDMQKGTPKTCRHPAIGSPDSTQKARKNDQYAMRHNPFMYFHSIIDEQARCDADVVPLTRLPGDLQAESTTPNYVFITPNLCHDGHDSPCADGEPGGLVSADAFLRKWVPRIVGSPAYRDGGLLAVIFDEGSKDNSACCGEKTGPNTPNNAGPEPGPGGGRTGAVLLSRYIKPGTVTKQKYNHYSLLRTVENMFGLSHLGYAAASGLRAFGSDIFTNPSGKHRRPVPSPTLKLRLTKPSGVCASRRFYARVAVTGSRVRTVLRLDGRVLRTTRDRRFKVRINVEHMRAGVHHVRASVTDRFGRRAQVRRHFRRCAHP